MEWARTEIDKEVSPSLSTVCPYMCPLSQRDPAVKHAQSFLSVIKVSQDSSILEKECVFFDVHLWSSFLNPRREAYCSCSTGKVFPVDRKTFLQTGPKRMWPSLDSTRPEWPGLVSDLESEPNLGPSTDPHVGLRCRPEEGTPSVKTNPGRRRPESKGLPKP